MAHETPTEGCRMRALLLDRFIDPSGMESIILRIPPEFPIAPPAAGERLNLPLYHDAGSGRNSPMKILPALAGLLAFGTTGVIAQQLQTTVMTTATIDNGDRTSIR